MDTVNLWLLTPTRGDSPGDKIADGNLKQVDLTAANAVEAFKLFDIDYTDVDTVDSTIHVAIIGNNSYALFTNAVGGTMPTSVAGAVLVALVGVTDADATNHIVSAL